MQARCNMVHADCSLNSSGCPGICPSCLHHLHTLSTLSSSSGLGAAHPCSDDARSDQICSATPRSEKAVGVSALVFSFLFSFSLGRRGGGASCLLMVCLNGLPSPPSPPCMSPRPRLVSPRPSACFTTNNARDVSSGRGSFEDRKQALLRTLATYSVCTVPDCAIYGALCVVLLFRVPLCLRSAVRLLTSLWGPGLDCTFGHSHMPARAAVKKQVRRYLSRVVIAKVFPRYGIGSDSLLHTLVAVTATPWSDRRTPSKVFSLRSTCSEYVFWLLLDIFTTDHSARMTRDPPTNREVCLPTKIIIYECICSIFARSILAL